MTRALAAGLPYPFELGFMQRALLAALCVGVFAPLIGTFLVQKRLSLIGDGIGHVAFAGVGAGVLLGVAELWVALAFAIAGAVGVEWLRRRRRASGDVALAILFYSGIALGVVLLSRADGLDGQVLSYLFGAPLTVTRSEVASIVALAVGVVAVVVALRRPLFSVVTDDDWSRVAGLPVDALNALLAVVTAVAVVAAMRIVGILLVAAMMVLPVATAQLLARSFAGTLRIAIGVGLVTSVAGLAASRFWGLAPGGTIVLLAAVVFAVASIARRALARSPVRAAA
ncbi:MAG TPA: metal ABC transporter permease [Actinomycetota bacterium]|nr:metal ABC transporter permease [Actinomycetota bacterium]